MFKYRVGMNKDPESNAMAKQIEGLLKEGRKVRVGHLSGIVDGVAWPSSLEGTKDRSGYSILLMNHGNPLKVLYQIIDSYITNSGYVAFGWGDIEFTDE